MWFTTPAAEPTEAYAIYLKAVGSKDKECIGSKASLIPAMEAADTYIRRHSLTDGYQKYEIVIEGPEYASWVNRGLGWSKAT